ncbi:hypothetical protein BpsM61_00072 [Bacillus phage vB_BpsM-61]|nr:hypothetical protein BpsM61_00072 [Bacillus phage vB_BpsM-61]
MTPTIEVKIQEKNGKNIYLITIDGETSKTTSKREKTHAVLVRGRFDEEPEYKHIWGIYSMNGREDLAQKTVRDVENRGNFEGVMMIELVETK